MSSLAALIGEATVSVAIGYVNEVLLATASLQSTTSFGGAEGGEF